jgi:hypothetical protein
MSEPASEESSMYVGRHRPFEVSVVSVRTAAQINTEPGAGLDTAGVWVLVLVRAMADQESTWLSYATVRDSGGQIWSATERIDQPLINSGYRLDPRIPVEAEVAFEVPREVATDLTIRLAEFANGLYGLQMEPVVEVPLRVDEAAVASGLALPEPIEIEEYPRIVIADPQILVVEPE